MNREQVNGLSGHMVELRLSDFIQKARKLPTTLYAARLARTSLAAVLLHEMVDGETGEILTYPGEDTWLPLSQILWMHKAGEQEPLPEEEDDSGLTDPLPGEPVMLEIDSEPASVEQLAYERKAWERETAGVAPDRPLVCHAPALITREMLSGSRSESGPATVAFFDHFLELAVEDEEGFPQRLRILDDAIGPVAILAFLAESMLADTVEARMPLTIRQLEITKAAAEAFLEATDNAIREIEEQTFNAEKQRRPPNYKDHTAFASKAGGAVRRASMGLTRSLADLRRPG